MVRALSKLPPSYMTARDDMESPGGRLPWDGPPQTLSANPLCPQARHFARLCWAQSSFPQKLGSPWETGAWWLRMPPSTVMD